MCNYCWFLLVACFCYWLLLFLFFTPPAHWKNHRLPHPIFDLFTPRLQYYTIIHVVLDVLVCKGQLYSFCVQTVAHVFLCKKRKRSHICETSVSTACVCARCRDLGGGLRWPLTPGQRLRSLSHTLACSKSGTLRYWRRTRQERAEETLCIIRATLPSCSGEESGGKWFAVFILAVIFSSYPLTDNVSQWGIVKNAGSLPSVSTPPRETFHSRASGRRHVRTAAPCPSAKVPVAACGDYAAPREKPEDAAARLPQLTSESLCTLFSFCKTHVPMKTGEAVKILL